MALDPKPYIMFDGARLECSLSAIAPVVLDDISVDWGRTNYFENPKAALGRFRIYDRTDFWPNIIRSKAAVGKPVAFFWELPGNPVPAECWFQGRVSDIDVRPGRTLENGAPTWIIDVTCAEKTAYLGNIFTPKPTVWPAENLQSRAVRIRDSTVASGIGERFFHPQTVTWPCPPLDCGGRSYLDLQNDFYASTGDTWAYDPQTNNIRNIRRRQFSPVTKWMRMDPASGFMGTAGDITFDTVLYKGTALSGCEVEPISALELNPSTALNRVELTYRDTAAPTEDRTMQRAATVPMGESVRSLTQGTWVGNVTNVGNVADYLFEKGTLEGSWPIHPRLRWKTKTFPMESIRQVRTFLKAGETMQHTFVNGTPWFEFHRQMPLFGICGGTIRYRAAGWIIDMDLQWMANLAAAFAPMTWAEANTGLKWGTVPGSFYFDSSVTWFDTTAISDKTNVYNQGE